MTQFIISAIIAYLGLVVGIILVHLTEEEIKPGTPYFIQIHNILVASILFFILHAYTVAGVIQLFTPLITLAILYKYESYKKSYIIYPLLGIISALAFKTEFFIIIISLIFFYGFIVGSLNYNLKKKNYLKIVVRNLGFLIASLLILIL